MDVIKEVINVDMSVGSKIQEIGTESEFVQDLYQHCCYGCRNILRYSERTCPEPTLAGWVHTNIQKDALKEQISEYLIDQ